MSSNTSSSSGCGGCFSNFFVGIIIIGIIWAISTNNQQNQRHAGTSSSSSNPSDSNNSNNPGSSSNPSDSNNSNNPSSSSNPGNSNDSGNNPRNNLINNITANIDGEQFNIHLNRNSTGIPCQDRDDGQIHDRNYIYPGKTVDKQAITFQTVFQCSGWYTNGYFSYTETVIQDRIHNSLDPGLNTNCYPNYQYTYIHFEGPLPNLPGPITTGKYSYVVPQWHCNVDGQQRMMYEIYNRSNGGGSGTW